MRLRQVDAIELDEYGARGDRCFYVVDERGRMVNGKQFPRLQTIVPDYDPAAGELTLTFPDGHRAQGRVAYGDPVTTRFYRRSDQAPELQGPCSSELSEFIGHPLRIVGARTGVDRGREGGASIFSRASLGRVAQAADRPSVDARRFRMLIEVDGAAAHEEDSTEPLPFGIYGEVLEGGVVRLGDPVSLDGG
jgi:uncharacterized protein YcbX